MPQCVINKGPDASKFVFFTFTWAKADKPIKSFIRGSFILNVKREGTASTT